MSERRFWIKEVTIPVRKTTSWWKHAITLSEFHRRIDLAFRAAFCTLDEKFDYDKAVEIIVHGEGENQHDLPGCEEEAGPNWNGKEEKGKRTNYTLQCPLCKLYHGKEPCPPPELANKYKQPSHAPTREEWAENIAISFVDSSRERNILELKARILSMPTGPR